MRHGNKPVPGHLGISFAFGAFTVALACQKLLLLRCYFGHQEVISRMESSSRDALANTRLGLHFKWCKYLMPSEVKVTHGKLYARILQKISTMDLLYARTLVKKKLYHGLDGKMASFVQGPCKDFYHGW